MIVLHTPTQAAHYKVIYFLSALRSAANIMVEIYTNGGCYRLHELLKILYPSATAYSNRDAHVITKIEGRFYDINGEVLLDTDLYIPMSYIEHCMAEGSGCVVTPLTISPQPWLTEAQVRQEIDITYP